MFKIRGKLYSACVSDDYGLSLSEFLFECFVLKRCTCYGLRLLRWEFTSYAECRLEILSILLVVMISVCVSWI